MQMRLKGINQKKVKLANGQTVSYYYAWKGGPRISGEPGTPEFLASFNGARVSRRSTSNETLSELIQAFRTSSDFMSLSPRSQLDYSRLLQKIVTEFADFPLAALADRRARGEFLSWRDRLAMRSRRQADYAYSVLARTFSWACNRGLVSINPCEKAGRLYRGNRADKIWTETDEAAFMSTASAPLQLAFQLALWTGQRQGDLLRLPWRAYDGACIRLTQGKTGVRVVIPVGAPLRAMMDSTRRVNPLILVNQDGNPWTPDGFRASWSNARKRAGVEGVTFHDLRGTAVTRLALAGATEAEIATITGHSLRDVKTTLDANYLRRDAALAENAIRKLERRVKTPEATPEFGSRVRMSAHDFQGNQWLGDLDSNQD